MKMMADTDFIFVQREELRDRNPMSFVFQHDPFYDQTKLLKKK